MSIPDDRTVRARVRVALEADPDVDAVDAVVDVTDGVVRLHGVVGSYAEKLEAVSVADRQPGVRSVVNDLRVRPYGRHWRMTDQQIADGVRTRLGLALVESGEVDFVVDHHVVTLTGRVPSIEERALVRHVVATTPGVDLVENRIEVRA